MNTPSGLRDPLILWISFILVLILQVIACPKPFDKVPASWLPMLLIYWVLSRPECVNIGTSFYIGLIWDLELGSLLGVRALALSLLAYSVASNTALLRNLTLSQQTVLIIPLILATHGLIFCIERLLSQALFSSQLFWSVLISGLLWPGLFLLLQKLRGQWKIY
ncbi:rod shape-determining protein MreD [unidentified bacterial endosymbiont]|uniref:rod shape-determining protein MreD n=1 Tax=unidentified bacterial endosymbiont TaxID=2355 RepID=UPI0020A0F8AF|nr:rod shape-determining protein MreD [unidentified bacterial endosymbiont]